MRYMSLLVLFAVLLSSAAFAAPPAEYHNAATPMSYDTDKRIDVNMLEMVVTNRGSFSRWIANNDISGLWYPRGTDKTVVYASGLWVGGTVNGETRVTVAEYAYEYTPGYIESCEGGPYNATDDPDYYVYKIYKGDDNSNPDYANWPFDQGAPYVDANNNNRYDEGELPRITGDQTLFSVYHDGVPDQHINDAGGTLPMNIEVQHTTFGFDRADPLGNVIFFQMKVINKGCDTIEDTYFSLWSDPDLGGSGDDLVGCDTDLSLGYCYNATNNDNVYGSAPPAVGFDFFQGPLVPDTTAGAEVTLPDGRVFEGMKILGMTSFNKYTNGTDPHSPTESYFYMQGLEPNGDDLIDQYTGSPTHYYHDYDPTTGVGWIDTNAADRRFMLSSGPFTLDPWEDTDGDGEPDLGEPGVQEVVAAIIVGQGGDRLSSISVMKYFDQFAQEAFDKAFVIPDPPPPPEVSVVTGDQHIILYWDDRSEVDSDSEFEFEGYNIYQFGYIGDLNPRKIGVYDIDNGVGHILQKEVDPNAGDLVDVVKQVGSDSGIRRSVMITEDAKRGLDLYNGSTYLFAVTAYSYNEDPEATIRTLENSAQIIEAVPNALNMGDNFEYVYDDVIDASHISGKSDGIVRPVIVDPSEIIDADYEVTFREITDAEICGFEQVLDDSTGEVIEIIPYTCTVWDAKKTVDGVATTIFENQLEAASQDLHTQLLSDGFLLKVTGPPPGVKQEDMYSSDDENTWGWDIPQGNRRFTWANADFGWEGFRGAIGWGSPQFNWGGAEDPMVAAPDLKKVLLILAHVGSDTVFFNPPFDMDDENLSYAYRYGRNFGSDPQEPEFAEYMPNGGSYDFQDFEKSVPLSAWDVEDPDNPRRLVVGFLENNQPRTYDEETGALIAPGGGLVDGKWWPGDHGHFDNTAGGGPREWLFIYDADYSETINDDFTGNLIDDAMPVMYWLTVNRRGEASFSPGGTGEDHFTIVPAYINTPADKFTFTSVAPTLDDAELVKSENQLDDVKVVPNPYYCKSSWEPNQFERKLQFTHLPAKCTIRIFNLAGDLVRKINKDDPPSANDDDPSDPSSIYEWDLTNSNEIPIASGIYIWHLESDFGETYGKVAIFMEEERMTEY
ncbi:MAG: hypothetical protein B6244_01920 [Candidatus Cloacimonetes bacterium 4572_55]|nr:MAG: hypothetical protein B6244_01920 [Candidatus Cloacimonetes bacterium 4572_55]